MSTNYYAVIAPCDHCGQSMSKPTHLGKQVSTGFLLHLGAGGGSDSLDFDPPSTRAGWIAVIKRRDVAIRTEYRESVTKREALRLVRTAKSEQRGWFR